MIHRTLIGAALIGLVGLPYVLSTQKGGPPTPEAGLPADLLAAAPPRLDVPPRLPGSPAADGRLASSGLGSEGLMQGLRPDGTVPAPPTSLDDIFRFDLTAEQVMHTWPMVTTTTNQPDLKGYRVPLVTGGRPESLAGSLTYYFDKEQRLQRIVFHGTTGEPRPLIQLVVQKFQFKPDATDAGMLRYDVRRSGKPVSELRVEPAQVVDAGQPLRRFAVNLLIERPQESRWFKGTTSGISGLRL
jgi:Family of unknown function (DUF6690)